MENKEFVWTDAKVKEFAGKLRQFGKSIDEYISEFKAEHSKPVYPTGIISFKNDRYEGDGICTQQEMPYQQWCKYHLECKPESTIHQVKNSSGLILTVGDETNEGIIKSFSHTNISIFAKCGYPINEVNIDYLKPAKPTFKTEDGYNIFDTCWVTKVFPDFSSERIKIYEPFSPSEGCKYFDQSTAADKYIFENKPEFSRKQIRDAQYHIVDQNRNNNIFPETIVIDKSKLSL